MFKGFLFPFLSSIFFSLSCTLPPSLFLSHFPIQRKTHTHTQTHTHTHAHTHTHTHIHTHTYTHTHTHTQFLFSLPPTLSVSLPFSASISLSPFLCLCLYLSLSHKQYLYSLPFFFLCRTSHRYRIKGTWTHRKNISYIRWWVSTSYFPYVMQLINLSQPVDLKQILALNIVSFIHVYFIFDISLLCHFFRRYKSE